MNLKFEMIAPDIYTSLDEVKRTGWVERGVSNPESVYDHTVSLIKLANELSASLKDEERFGLTDMLEVHDWPEAKLGDEVILELRPGERKILKERKFQKELRALEDMCATLPNGDDIVSTWNRFETSMDPAAVFARELDKYQAVEKALEYEKTQGIALFEEFLTYSINFIHHPLLLERVERLKSEWES